MLEKATTIKRFVYSPLGRVLKKQTDIAKKKTDITKEQYQRIDKVYRFDKTVVNKKREKSNLVYNNF